MERLVEMLSFMRPAFSVYEEAFIDRYIEPLKPTWDNFGNAVIDIGDDAPNVLWSSHTDTVHRFSGLQEVIVKRGIAAVHPNNKGKNKPYGSNCLGADCTTGVWLMTEMIKARVPGRYIFHRDEEAGGNGSEYISKNRTAFLDGIDFAVAFDRRGKSDIVTHMNGRRTCSGLFAGSLNLALGGGFKNSSWGMFTDTRSYINQVSECTNLAVGYEHAHTSNETQDLHFAVALRDKLLKIDTKKLVKSRDPAKVEYQSHSTNAYHGGTYTAYTPFENVIRANPHSVVEIFNEGGITEEAFRNWIYAKKTAAA